MRRLFSLGLILALTACVTIHRKSRPDLPDEERGVAELMGLVRDFAKALHEEDFDTADEIVDELDDGVKNADVKTISHPDYSDVMAAVDHARPALELARHNYAVRTLIEATTVQLDRGDDLLDRIVREGPNDDLLDDLEETTEELQDLDEEGQPLRTDEKYAAFAQRLDARLKLFPQKIAENRWRLDATERLGDVFGGAFDPERRATDSRNIAELIAQTERLAEIYEGCHTTTGELIAAEGYVAKMKLATPLGQKTIEQLRHTCATRHKAAARKAANLRWKRKVRAVAESVSKAVNRLGKQKTAADLLEANTAAVQALTGCATGLQATEDDPGFDSSLSFDTAWGARSAPALRAQCTAERDKLKTEQPTIKWRVALEKLRRRIDEAKALVDRAVAMRDPQTRLDPFTKALGGYRECIDRAEYLLSGSDPMLQQAKPTRHEYRVVKALAKGCARDVRGVGILMDRAKKEKAAADKAAARAARKKRKKKR